MSLNLFWIKFTETLKDIFHRELNEIFLVFIYELFFCFNFKLKTILEKDFKR